eukprot:TRINITY_DN99676_c0_g1_i1.p1 TRINITY_DN99676_c0_g1~~TRINITY_DN99676_c0_g1_i1.p1  ORF type:complete len:524 (+),score=105.02 TRINITY_DN99676_c0_g1_i1:47-1573(+)
MAAAAAAPATSCALLGSAPGLAPLGCQGALPLSSSNLRSWRRLSVAPCCVAGLGAAAVAHGKAGRRRRMRQRSSNVIVFAEERGFADSFSELAEGLQKEKDRLQQRASQLTEELENGVAEIAAIPGRLQQGALDRARDLGAAAASAKKSAERSVENVKQLPRELAAKIVRPFEEVAAVGAAAQAKLNETSASSSRSLERAAKGYGKVIAKVTSIPAQLGTGVQQTAGTIAAVPDQVSRGLGNASRALDSTRAGLQKRVEFIVSAPEKVSRGVSNASTGVQRNIESIAALPDQVSRGVNNFTTAVSTSIERGRVTVQRVLELPTLAAARIGSVAERVGSTAAAVAEFPQKATATVSGAVTSVQRAAGGVGRVASDAVSLPGKVASGIDQIASPIGKAADGVAKRLDNVVNFPQRVIETGSFAFNKFAAPFSFAATSVSGLASMMTKRDEAVQQPASFSAAPPSDPSAAPAPDSKKAPTPAPSPETAAEAFKADLKKQAEQESSPAEKKS